MGQTGFDYRMLNTEGGIIVHDVAEECRQKRTKEFKIERLGNKQKKSKDGHNFLN